MCFEEPMGLTRRFETFHYPFSIPSWLMRQLRSIVGILSSVMNNHRRQLAVSNAITS
jgi:hypothetical protein